MKTQTQPTQTSTRSVRVFSYLHHNQKVASVVKFSSQTDFALNTAETQEFAKQLMLAASFYRISDVDELLKQHDLTDSSVTLRSRFEALVSQLKESFAVDSLVVVA